MAAEVVARFLLNPDTPEEKSFKASLKEVRDHAGPQAWKINIMVATLYCVRRANWIWDLLT